MNTQPPNPEEFYKTFKERLDTTTSFPSYYTYKFIIPTTLKGLAEVQKIFDGANPQFNIKESKNGKYSSVTAVIYTLDSDQVIHYYLEAAKIEGIIML